MKLVGHVIVGSNDFQYHMGSLLSERGQQWAEHHHFKIVHAENAKMTLAGGRVETVFRIQGVAQGDQLRAQLIM